MQKRVKKKRLRVNLPKDELPHKNQAIEWWYFNGFLRGKRDYAFMTCFFKGDKNKLNIGFLKFPFKDIYFSHSILFDLKSGKVKKETLPFVLVSKDSFKKKELFVNYFYPLRRGFTNYELSGLGKKLRVKNDYLDIVLKQNKKPLYENDIGFINLGKKTTYYYSYTNLDASGFVGKDKVIGKAWHDKQWSSKGYMKDGWLWFSFFLPNNTEIVCFDYKGQKMGDIIYANGKQKHCKAEFKPIGKKWKSSSGYSYYLEWEIKIGEFIIKTKPIIKNCEMNFGFIHYWEGPVEINVNGAKARGFMEYLSEPIDEGLKSILKNKEESILKTINKWI